MKALFFLIFLVSSLSAEVTFYVATDAHYGKNQWLNNEEINKKAIYDMNMLPSSFYPNENTVVQEPKGVLVLGDLTNTGSYWQWYGLNIFRFINWDGFLQDYGLNGEGLLNFPVLEGLGNHDNMALLSWVKPNLIQRNLQREEPLNLSDNNLHYSWDWEDVHFVQLNIYPGDSKEAEMSLTFLKHDLQNNLKDPNTPIVLLHHYGFDGYSDAWWTFEEREAYYNVIKDYNVVLIFQGHQHGMFHIKWKGYDVISAGSVQANQYLVCTIADNTLKVYSRTQNDWGEWQFEKKIND